MKQLKKTLILVIVDLKLIVQLTENVLLKESYIKQQLCIRNIRKGNIYIGSTGRQFKTRFYEHT